MRDTIPSPPRVPVGLALAAATLAGLLIFVRWTAGHDAGSVTLHEGQRHLPPVLPVLLEHLGLSCGRLVT